MSPLDTTHYSIGQNLRLAREQAEFTPTEAAARLGVSQKTLTRYEDGETPISYWSLCRAALLYRKPISWFGEPQIVKAGEAGLSRPTAAESQPRRGSRRDEAV